MCLCATWDYNTLHPQSNLNTLICKIYNKQPARLLFIEKNFSRNPNFCEAHPSNPDNQLDTVLMNR